jgi:hypothetical protein
VTNVEAMRLVLAMANGSASSEPDADREAALATAAQLIAIGAGKCPALQPPMVPGMPTDETGRPVGRPDGGSGKGA